MGINGSRIVRTHKGNVFIDVHLHSPSSPGLRSLDLFYIALQFGCTESVLSRDPLHVTTADDVAAQHGAERCRSVPIFTR